MSNSARTSFVPKEQFPSWEFLTALPHAKALWKQGTAKPHFFFWARNAIYYALKALGVSPGAHVLLPAYLCRAAVEPFEVFGASVGFYGVGRDCEPDFTEMEAKITARTEAIMAVHYFGFPQRIQDFRNVCDRRGLALIEDCAHVLGSAVSGHSLGTMGDASVFSWRKFLPLYDGGELRLRKTSGDLPVEWHKETLPFTLKVTKCLLDRTLEQSASPAAKAFSRGIESLKRAWRHLTRTPESAPLFELDSNRADFDPRLLDQKMSRASRWLLVHSDLAAILSRRRKNYSFLLENLRAVSGITPLHHKLPVDVCPWVFPLCFDGMSDAHLLLQREGIPAVTWGGVRPADVDPAVFPAADFLYDNLVFLPVHQNLGSEALDAIVAAVRRVRGTAAPQAAQSVSRFVW